MNFTTDLPKKNPLVTYIVASAVKCEKFFPKSQSQAPSYRMHAVILNSKLKDYDVVFKEYDLLQYNFIPKQPSQRFLKTKSYILCHVRKIDQNYNRSSKQLNQKRKLTRKLKQSKRIPKKLKLTSKGKYTTIPTDIRENFDTFTHNFYKNSYKKLLQEKKLNFVSIKVNLSQGLFMNNLFKKTTQPALKNLKKVDKKKKVDKEQGKNRVKQVKKELVDRILND